MLQTTLSIIKVLLALFKWPMIILICAIGVFMLDVMVWYVFFYFHGQRINRGSVRHLRKRNLLLRIFYDAPRQYTQDLFDMEPDFFEPQGLIIFTGTQGSGKTSALMQQAIDYKDSYPECKCISNTSFVYQDDALKHWYELVTYKNGHKGVVVIMDELQNWFSSNASRNFPPEMLSVITQNRKNRRVILGTAQNFYLLAKPIRGQTSEIRECHTLAGVLTIVVRRQPIIDDSGDVKELKYRGVYFFAHTPRLRESYDTYAVIENLSAEGFHDNPFLKEKNLIFPGGK